ncbi:hypothetical protein DYB31_014339, partial [Aphanomyces astaci]
NATVRVNPTQLKAVIEHFSDVLDMQTKMADAVAVYCDANLKDVADMEMELDALDPAGTLVVDCEVLRGVVKRYGFRFSRNKFQTFVRLQFQTRGTTVPYLDFTKLLSSLLRQRACDHDDDDENDDRDVTHPTLHHSNDLADGQVDSAAIAATLSLHEAIGLSVKKQQPMRQPSTGGSFRRPTPLLLDTLSAYTRVNAEDDAKEEAMYATLRTPASTTAAAAAAAGGAAPPTTRNVSSSTTTTTP